MRLHILYVNATYIILYILYDTPVSPAILCSPIMLHYTTPYHTLTHVWSVNGPSRNVRGTNDTGAARGGGRP